MQAILVPSILIGIFICMGLLSFFPGILLYPLLIFSILMVCGMVIMGLLVVIHAALAKDGALLLIGIVITLIGIGMTVGLFWGIG